MKYSIKEENTEITFGELKRLNRNIEKFYLRNK